MTATMALPDSGRRIRPAAGGRGPASRRGRYDVVVYTDTDPATASRRCRCCRAGRPHWFRRPGPVELATVVHARDRVGGDYAVAHLPVGDAGTVVYAAAAGDGWWQLVVCGFPARHGAGASLLRLSEELRCALWRIQARVIASRIQAATAIAAPARRRVRAESGT